MTKYRPVGYLFSALSAHLNLSYRRLQSGGEIEREIDSARAIVSESVEESSFFENVARDILNLLNQRPLTVG